MTKGTTKAKRPSDFMSVAEAQLYLAEFAANHNAAVAAKYAAVGGKVSNGNPKGRPVTLTDDELVKAWTAARREVRAWNWTIAAVSERALADLQGKLRKKGVELTADRITRRVRTVLQERGEWNGGKGPS